MNNMSPKVLIILSMLVASCMTQSPYFRRPIGYPVLEPASSTTQSNDLSNRAGDIATTMSTTTQRLPLEALGNRALVESLSRLPEDRQPFWLLNRQALEDHRTNAQTFEYKPSNFIDSSSFIGARGSPQGPQNFAQRPQGFAQTPQSLPFF